MNEKPILFNGEMVQAILDGRKTMTRRVIKPSKSSRTAWWFDPDIQWPIDQGTGKRLKCPYGRPGDLLWVRETWATWRVYDDMKPSDLPKDASLWWIADNRSHRALHHKPGRVRPSIHMPRWASRLTLRVTAVRVERVQEIDNHDSWREGIPSYSNNLKHYYGKLWANAKPRNPDRYFNGVYQAEARDVFAELWDSINAKRGYSWDSNPHVWVVEFERVD